MQVFAGDKVLVSQNVTNIVRNLFHLRWRYVSAHIFGPSSGHKRKLRKLYNVSHKISYIDLNFNEISSFFLL